MLCSFYPAILILFLQNSNVYITATWWGGTYALLKPKTGCPNGWQEEGRIQQFTGQNNDNSIVLHIQGTVSKSTVLRYFCIKKIEYYDTYRAWPTGQYCIYGTWNGHYYGNVRMSENKRSKITMNLRPFIYQDTSTWHIVFYFFCQEGNKKIPISLPITKPFYLLPYGSSDCQQVKWMVATSEWIKYGTNDYKDEGYHWQYGIPYHELGGSSSTGIKMYYCYYESCNYTLNDTKGVFQSPGFPGKYPDGQLCSWRIMVPDNHTLHVHFTHFSLYEYDKDCLQLYEKNKKIFKPKQAFFGYQEPFTITASSDLMLVFRSDEENNSTGFRANYTMFKTPERTTTTPKPPTTTTLPITTTQPTKLTTTKQPTTTLPTTKRPVTTEATTFLPTTTNTSSTMNGTMQCSPNQTKNKSYIKHSIHPLQKKTYFCDETWKIVVMVIPLAILIVLVIFDIVWRCRSKNPLKTGAGEASADDGMAANPTYGRGNIILDQTPDTAVGVPTVNTVDDQRESRDEPPDYEDLDYTQVNDIPPPRRSSKRQECYALDPIGTDTSSVFYHVLEHPNAESNGPQNQSAAPVGNGAPSYQNLSEVSHYTLNPAYESPENSAPFVKANKLYENYLA